MSCVCDRTNQTIEKAKGNEKPDSNGGVDLESNAITNAHVALEENQQKITMVIEHMREREVLSVISSIMVVKLFFHFFFWGGVGLAEPMRTD